VERPEAFEEAISPELALVDPDLAARAREALPDPPWLLPAVAEARQRVEAAPAVAVEEPAPEVSRSRDEPSFSRHLRTTVVFGCVMVALVTVVSLGLDLVPRSGKPTLAATPAEPAAATPPKTPTSKPAAKPAKVRRAVKPKPVRKAKPKPRPRPKPKPVRTRSPKRATPPASAPKHVAKPKARSAVKVERVFSWRPFRGAAYYQVHLQRGATTVYEVRTSNRTASIRLELKPGRYHAIVRPAISTDAGIILGPRILDKIVKA
jgi:outer membrane biosynthesis protein TonB